MRSRGSWQPVEPASCRPRYALQKFVIPCGVDEKPGRKELNLHFINCLMEGEF